MLTKGIKGKRVSGSQKSTPMDILLKSSADEGLPFLRLNFQNDRMLIELHIEDRGITTWEAPIDVHSIFELEKLSEGLRYVANGKLPHYIEVPSKEGWIGWEVGLTPGLWFQLGLVIGKSGRGVVVYVSRLTSLTRGTRIEIEATCNGFAGAANFEPDLILAFADELYSAASSLWRQTSCSSD